MPLSLHISDQQRTGLRPFLFGHLQSAHRLLRPALRELSVALVSSATIARLHREFMGLAGPTDVLTFELDHDGKNRVTSGEIVVCVPHARRVSKGNGLPLRSELLLYCIHGLLHLSGYDDRTQRGFNRMHRKEDKILESLGIGRVFETGAAPDGPRRSKGKHQ